MTDSLLRAPDGSPPSYTPAPPGSAERCEECSGRLIACYAGQQMHPMCDPNPPTWTPEQLTEWSHRIAVRTGSVTKSESRGRRSW